MRYTGDRRDGPLLGVQLVGHLRSEIEKRIDVPATAIFNEMTIDALSDLDLSYTPERDRPDRLLLLSRSRTGSRRLRPPAARPLTAPLTTRSPSAPPPAKQHRAFVEVPLENASRWASSQITEGSCVLIAQAPSGSPTRALFSSRRETSQSSLWRLLCAEGRTEGRTAASARRAVVLVIADLVPASDGDRPSRRRQKTVARPRGRGSPRRPKRNSPSSNATSHADRHGQAARPPRRCPQAGGVRDGRPPPLAMSS